MLNLLDLIDKYMVYLEFEKNMSVKTIENYALWLNRLVHQVGDIDIGDLTRMHLLDWRLALTKKGLSKKTINYHIIAVRAFLKFLHKMDIECMSPDKLELAKVPPNHVNFLTEDEINQLLIAPEKFARSERKRWRDKAILWTLYGSGLRVTELITLQKKDLPTDGEQMQIIGKGRKLRSVFLTKEANTIIQKRLQFRDDENPYVFTSVSNNSLVGEHVTRNAVEEMVRNYAKLTGLQKKVTPHVLRHSFATSLLKKGADIRAVQALLGHASITTTQIYTHVDDQHLSKVHDLLNKQVMPTDSSESTQRENTKK